MTAQQMIDSVKPSLSGLSAKDDDTTLLSFLNMAKDEIASDTLFWINGEEINLSSGTQEYTLTNTPIMILDVYDNNLEIITRNSYDSYSKGYFQVSPNKIKLTYNPSDSDVLYVNYYLTPDDYLIDDSIAIPPSLYKAVRHYIKHEALSMYKDEKSIQNAKLELSTYNMLVQKFIENTDVKSNESLLRIDMIKDKGLV